MEFTDEELETLENWYMGLMNDYPINEKDVLLHARISDQITYRQELAIFQSDCGDSCKL